MNGFGIFTDFRPFVKIFSSFWYYEKVEGPPNVLQSSGQACETGLTTFESV